MFWGFLGSASNIAEALGSQRQANANQYNQYYQNQWLGQQQYKPVYVNYLNKFHIHDAENGLIVFYQTKTYVFNDALDMLTFMSHSLEEESKK